MVPVVQLVRASDCGSECRGFESHRAPNKETLQHEILQGFFVYDCHDYRFLTSSIVKPVMSAIISNAIP